MADDQEQERQERATPKRREEARRKGRVAKSREVAPALTLIAVVALGYFAGERFLEQMLALMREGLAGIAGPELTASEAHRLLREYGAATLLMMAPILVSFVVVGTGAHLLQTGFLLTPEPLAPQWGRVSPLAGIKRLFNRLTVVEGIKVLAKLLIVGFLCWWALHKELAQVTAFAGLSPDQIAGEMGGMALRILFYGGLMLAALAALDYGAQRWDYERSLRMSRQEIKEEFKQQEGDPMIRSRIRALQREQARRRMMEAVPKADVVITNPTHLAVALQYRSREMAAPRVVAKGAGFVAEKIREIALSHGVPLMEDKPLAQALYQAVDVGREIPASLYHAVAEVLAHVYRLGRRQSGIREQGSGVRGQESGVRSQERKTGVP